MNFRKILFLSLVPLLAHADSPPRPADWTWPAYRKAYDGLGATPAQRYAAAAAYATAAAARLGTTTTTTPAIFATRFYAIRARATLATTTTASMKVTPTAPATKPKTSATTTTTAPTTTAATTTTTAQVPGTRNVYISIRTDNVKGDGSANNPFDGSTQARFDAAIATLGALGNSTPVVLHLAAGVYTITPVIQLHTAANPGGFNSNVPGNLTIIGAGEAKTTVRAGIVTTPATYWVFEQMGPNGGVSYEDLTIDCNMENQVVPKVTIDGAYSVNFGGTNMNTIAQNVHVINGGQPPNGPGASEWFGIEILDGRTGALAQVRNCLVDHFQGVAGCTALVATHYIANNLVELNNSDPYNFAGVANPAHGHYQNAYSPAQHVLNNVCHNCTFGIYSDVDNNHDIDIENNWFDAIYGGVFLLNGSTSATLTNVTINKNVMLRSYFFSIVLGSGATTPVNSNFTITNNMLETRDIPSAQGSIFALQSVKNCVISNNVVSTSTHNYFPPPIPGSFPDSDLGTITWSNNRYSPGATIPVPPGMKD